MSSRRSVTRCVLITFAAFCPRFGSGCGEGSHPVVPPAAWNGSEPSDEAALRAEDKAVILANVIQLIETAPTNTGGSNFTMAAESLNDFFSDYAPAEFRLAPDLSAFLMRERAITGLIERRPETMEVIQASRFDGLTDGRHLEDTLLLRNIAKSVLARGDSDASGLEQARTLFRWVVSQIQLVPPGELGDPRQITPDGSPLQAQARPYDVALRGMATEIEGGWAERSWLFIALCRQAGLDAGLLVLVPTPPRTQSVLLRESPPHEEPRSLWCGVLVDGQVFLFDLQRGLEIPGPDGTGVATLEQAATDPAVLEQLDLFGERYPVRFDDLARGKIRVLVEVTLGSVAPRMKLLQEQLTKDRRMVLYRDPLEVSSAFAQAIGSRLESVQVWTLPIDVEYRLFHDGAFNKASGFAVQLFNSRWPLLSARLMHLRGELDDAVEAYVKFRFAEEPLEADNKTPVDPQVQAVLDIYATHFLALAQLDRGRREEAGFLFGEALKMLPEPAKGLPYFTMFRWGATQNLGRLHAADGRHALAVRYLSLTDPTDQDYGTRLLAGKLALSSPFVPEAETPLPPEPPTTPPWRVRGPVLPQATVAPVRPPSHRPTPPTVARAGIEL